LTLASSLQSQTTPKTAPSIQEVYAYIFCSGIKYPDIVLRQVIWETGWLKSKHMMHKNNLFGFRHSKQYMHFKSWQESIDYYKNWQLRNYTRPDEDYYTFLMRMKYATSKKYISSLKSLKVKTDNVDCNEEQAR
jgi:hypothetical protein